MLACSMPPHHAPATWHGCAGADACMYPRTYCMSREHSEMLEQKMCAKWAAETTTTIRWTWPFIFAVGEEQHPVMPLHNTDPSYNKYV